MRATVIGAGVAGLATSIRLAKKGYQVKVFEANSYAGGKLSSKQLGKFRFDAGPSLFTMPEYVKELTDLGKDQPEFTYLRKDVLCNYFYDDGLRFTAYADRDRFIREAQDRLGANPKLLRDYLDRAKLKYNLTAPLFLERSLHKASTYLSMETIKAVANLHKLHLNEDLNTVNRKMNKDNPKLVQLFNRYATYNGSSPYKTPGIMSMIPHLEHYLGTYFPKGGMIAITNALMKTAQSLGVEFFFNTKVKEIRVENKKAKAIVYDDKTLESDIIVSNMDIVPTYRKLMPTEKSPEKSLTQERSSSAVIFYWGIKGQFPDLDLHNIFFSADYQKEFEEIFDQKVSPSDPTIYINITAKEEAEDAPLGCENWFVMVNVPANIGQDWDEQIKSLRKVVLRRLSKTLNKDIESLIVEEDYLDPRRIEQQTSSYQGALYGAASNNKFAAFLRHPNFSNKIKSLYFCGGSVHPGGGIPLCLLSAKIVSELVPNAA